MKTDPNIVYSLANEDLLKILVTAPKKKKEGDDEDYVEPKTLSENILDQLSVSDSANNTKDLEPKPKKQ
jgi:hypothetical protein